MGEIVDFTGTTTLEIHPDKILEAAVGHLSQVLVIGFDHNGGLYRASSTSEVGQLLLLNRLAEHALIREAQG